jgi:hypothetical protein
MRSLIWINEEVDIGPEIQITQKILILEQIWIYYNSNHQNYFSAKLVNTKVVDNFVGFPESTRIQIFDFVCEIYGQNIKLDRDKFEQDKMT